MWAAWEPTHQNEVVPLGALETLWRTHNSEAAFNALHPVVHEEIRRMLTEHITHATHPKKAEDADADIHPPPPSEEFSFSPDPPPTQPAGLPEAHERAKANEQARTEADKASLNQRIQELQHR